jgi:hypothetical protein
VQDDLEATDLQNADRGLPPAISCLGAFRTPVAGARG